MKSHQDYTYKERLDISKGRHIMYKHHLSFEDVKYQNTMDTCCFRKLNQGDNTFSLVESDTPNTYTFHFEKVFVTDITVHTYLDKILSCEWNIKEKWQALRSLYKFWHESVD